MSADFSRHSHSKLAAAGPAVDTPAAAPAAPNRFPQGSAQPSSELPIERFNRHAAEVSAVLNDYLDGHFYASIYPSEHAAYEIALHRIATAGSLEAQLDACVSRLKSVLRQMSADQRPLILGELDDEAVIVAPKLPCLFTGEGTYMVRVRGEGYLCDVRSHRDEHDGVSRLYAAIIVDKCRVGPRVVISECDLVWKMGD